MTALNQEQKNQIAEAERLYQKKKVLQKYPLFSFVPWGEQIDFFKSECKIKLVIGSNRSGKSEVGAVEHVSQVQSVRHDGSRTGLQMPPGDHICLFSKRLNIELVFMKKLKKYAHPSWIKRIKNGTDGLPEIITWVNDSRTFLGSYNQGADVQEGPDWVSAWFDEPPPRDVWISVKRGLTDVHGTAIFTFTALNCPWIYDDLFAKSDGRRISVHKILLRDNPHISEAAKQEFIDSVPEDQRAARIDGEFSHLAGAIFPEFSRSRHVIPPFEIPRDWPRFLVKDPHSRRPSYMVWVAVDPANRKYVYNEWPHTNFFAETTCRLTITDYVGIIAAEEVHHPAITDRIMDPNYAKTRSQTTGETLVDEYADAGLFFETEINNDISLGHTRIHEWLQHGPSQEPDLFVFATCPNMIKAFEIYSWNEKDLLDYYGTKERPLEAGKDPIDTLRYLADYDPTYLMGQTINVYEDESYGVTGYGN